MAVRQRMLFVCGGCTHYWSAVATGPDPEALRAKAAELQRDKPKCPKCDMKPPLWRFEAHAIEAAP